MFLLVLYFILKQLKVTNSELPTRVRSCKKKKTKKPKQLTVVFLEQCEKTLELWNRKVVTYCKQSLMGSSSRSLGDSVKNNAEC